MPENKPNKLHLVYLGIGSNISPEKNLPLALNILRETTQVITVSKVWNTPAVGSDGPDFLNAAIAIQTELSADELKNNVLRKIEKQLGRVRTQDKNAPRPVDIDILIYENILFDPEIWSQVHLAVPLAEHIPNYINPESGETLTQAAQRLVMESSIYETEILVKEKSGS